MTGLVQLELPRLNKFIKLFVRSNRQTELGQLNRPALRVIIDIDLALVHRDALVICRASQDTNARAP